MPERTAMDACGSPTSDSPEQAGAGPRALERRGCSPAAWIGGFGVLFGLLTLVGGGRVLVASEVSQADVPIVMPLVVFNVIAAFAYVGAGVGIALGRRWSSRIAAGLALANGLAFLALAVFLAHGGAVAERSIIVMTLRTAIWSSIALWCRLVQPNG